LIVEPLIVTAPEAVTPIVDEPFTEIAPETVVFWVEPNVSVTAPSIVIFSVERDSIFIYSFDTKTKWPLVVSSR
jgi:hypothetical protein